MTFLDQYIFHLLVLSPVSAAIFITLIPTIDTASKLSISRFFSLAGLAIYLRLFFLFINRQIALKTVASLTIINFNINFTLTLNQYNVFLYGAAAILLVINTLSYETNDLKTNMHQAIPFVLVFTLYIIFGQTDLRVALPILSIGNFLVYFLIAETNKVRRGSTIFQMGIFLFSCDALALVLLQIPFDTHSSFVPVLFQFALLIPGLSRLCLPMVSPFMRKLFLNVDDSEGPFILLFLNLSGFFILLLVYQDLNTFTPLLSILTASIIGLGSVFTVLLAINEQQTRTIPFHCLIFYSSLASMILFLSRDGDLIFFSISIILVNMICFFYFARTALRIRQKLGQAFYCPQLRSTLFLMASLFIGIPGLGIGTPLLAAWYRILELKLHSGENSYSVFWQILFIIFALNILLLSYALIKNLRNEENYWGSSWSWSQTNPTLIDRSFVITPWLIALISLLLSAAVFYSSVKLNDSLISTEVAND